MFRTFGTGNILTSDPLDGSKTYSTLEQLDGNDYTHYTDLGRPIRGIYDNEYEIYLEMQNMLNTAFSVTFGVFNTPSFGRNFLIDATDGYHAQLQITPSPAAKTDQYYLRMPTGIAYTNNGTYFVNKPRTDILERQLFKVLQMYDKDREYVQIKFDLATNKFKAKICKIYLLRNITITEVVKTYYFGCAGTADTDFTNETYSSGYSHSAALLEAVSNYTDTYFTFMPFFITALGATVDLTKLMCEPMVKLTTGVGNTTYYWKIDTSGNIVINSSGGGGTDITCGDGVVNTSTYAAIGTIHDTRPIAILTEKNYSGATVNFATAATTLNIDAVTATQTINVGSGATINGATKTINIGTSGVSGSTNNINIGSAVAGATNTVKLGGYAVNGYGYAAVTTNATTSIALDLTFIGNLLYCTSGSAISITVPNDAGIAFPIGTQIDVVQAGAGKITFSGTGTINSKSGYLSTSAQWVGVSLVKTASNTWSLFGDLTT